MAASQNLSFLLGLGVGGAVGLLFAPRPGEALRTDLRSRAEDGGDFLRRRSGELRHQTEEILKKGRGSFDVRKDRMAAALAAGRQAYRSSVAASADSEPT